MTRGERQIDRIKRQQRIASARRELLERLKARRRGYDVMQFSIDQMTDRDILYVESELLIRADDLSNPLVGKVLKDVDFVHEPIDCLRNRVARLRPRAGTSDIAQLKRILGRLKRAGGVASLALVTPNQVIMKSDATPEDADPLPPHPPVPPPTDSKVRVAVLDTGIFRTVRKDGWLTNVPEDADNTDPRWVYSASGFLDFAAGHGTFIAGIYEQVDPGVQVRVYRELDTDGIVGEVKVACAIVECVEREVAELGKRGRVILNLSLGTDTPDDAPPIALLAALQIVRQIEADKGVDIMVVAAAGNEGRDRPCWPAAFADSDDKVVAVSSLEINDAPSDWATRGDWVSCSIRGESVVSTYVEGKENPQLDPLDPETFPEDAWASWTGTSFATPWVGAKVASISQADDLSLTDALAKVFADYGFGQDPKYGRLLRF
jgi:subtilisin family serine protease